jgi:hypothetical protein
VLPRLDRERLDGWLELVHPDHEWRTQLQSG